MIEQFVRDRLAAMAARPGMWASTRAELGLQLVLLVEVHCVAHGAAFDSRAAMRAIFGSGPAVDGGPLDDEWAGAAVRTALGMLDSTPRR